MAGKFVDGKFVFEDQAEVENACPADPMEALHCDSCQ